jgi:hypothetical protein
VLVNAKIIGMVECHQYGDWCNSNCETLPVLYPKILEFQAVPGGINMRVAPLHPAKTKQELVEIRPSYVEVIMDCDYASGVIADGEGIEGERKLMQLYKESIELWKAEISGLVVPINKISLK